jgi:spore germination protein YaaH
VRRLIGTVLLAASGACASVPLIGRSAPVEQWAFTAPWDRRSAASVQAHGAQLDGLVLDWIPLDTVTGQPYTMYTETLGASLPPETRRLALLTNYAGDHFSPVAIRRLANDPQRLTQSADAIAERLVNSGTRGVIIDFEGMSGIDTLALRGVVSVIADRVRARNAGPVIVALPAMDTVGYAARQFASADLLLVMLYDQHWATSPPGPIASPEWVRRALSMRVAEAGVSRVVAALPLYGYQWRPNLPTRAISIEDARRVAAEAGVALERDPATATLTALRSGPDPWELWVTDLEQLNLLRREVVALGIRRLAYWRLGLEDAEFWRQGLRR